MKVNLDLTANATENLIEDDYFTDVGSPTFTLHHDFFYGEEKLEIWTGAGKTGTLLGSGDYSLGVVDIPLTEQAGRNVYLDLQVTNVTYQTGDLYFTYQACADFVDADDRYKVERVIGQYWELGFSGDYVLNTTSTASDSIRLNSAGGINATGTDIVVSASADLTFKDQYLTSAIPLSESGTTGLSGFTAVSIVGALNEVGSIIGVPSGGVLNDLLIKQSATDGDATWGQGSGSGIDADLWDGAHKTVSTSVPSGGADGDIWFVREA